MSLWVNKYQPKKLEAMSYHVDLSSRLQALAASEFPHMLVYGPSGAGKKTRVSAVLRELFGERAAKIKMDSRVLQINSRKIEFNVVTSLYHMEITPSDLGNNDRIVIQQLLKEMAQTQQVDANAQHRFKVVVINEADSLTRDAQSALRRTMEKYTPNLRLILLANSTSNIIAPIRSRTLLVRVACPSQDEIVAALKQVADAERVNYSDDEALHNVARQSDGNLRKALLMLEAMHAQNDEITPATVVPPADWEVVISNISKDIYKKRTVAQIAAIRLTFYELLSHCIPATVIIKTLLLDLLKNIHDSGCAAQVIEAAAQYDHRLRLGSKAIFHLEAFVAKTMRLLEQYEQ